jgi:serine protease Do
MLSRCRGLATAACTVLALAVAGCGRPVQPPAAPPGEPAQASTAQTSPANTPVLPTALPLPHPAFGTASGSASIADIAERVTPSVVSVHSTKLRRAPEVPFPLWPFFGPGPAPEERQQGLGSGVIVADGIVVTNNHVVEDADEVKVTSYDNHQYDVDLLGRDPKSDLAVLRLKGNIAGLRSLPMGDSSRLRLGDVVLAIGNPFGVGQTVTMGIVSAKGRADLGILDYEDFIQTDAAINPGNSGGALVDMQGTLVGINTAILSRSGGSQGIGFAIPTNMARPLVESLLKHGKVVRGWLGVSIQNIDDNLAAALHLPSKTGVLVSDVGPNSPAGKAGIQRGDVILKVNGETVDSTGRLRNLVAASGVSSKAQLEILRNGKTLTVPVALGEMPSDSSALREPKPETGAAPSTLDGLTLEGLNAANRARFRVSGDIQTGVVVTDVDRNSPAARAGLRPGDVLLEIDRQKVTNVGRFKELWSRAKGRTLLLLYRQGQTIFMVVTR